MKPLCVDLFCGLGGWAEGFLAEGYDVIGFDVERHDYGTGGYPGQLVIQDVLTLHGAQFKDAAVIVASPPCQFFSRMAMPFKMPWKQEEYERRKKLAHELFWAGWRIQHEASEVGGRFIPLIVENVLGAQKWNGRSRYIYGSFHLWGDIPALMPEPVGRKNTGGSWFGQRDGLPLERNNPRDMRRSNGGEYVNATAVGGWNHSGKALDGRKCASQHDTYHKDGKPVGKLIDPRYRSDGLKFGGGWWNDSTNNLIRKASSRSTARKAASAQIAKIPFPLAQHIARCFKPAKSASMMRG